MFQRVVLITIRFPAIISLAVGNRAGGRRAAITVDNGYRRALPAAPRSAADESASTGLTGGATWPPTTSRHRAVIAGSVSLLGLVCLAPPSPPLSAHTGSLKLHDGNQHRRRHRAATATGHPASQQLLRVRARANTAGTS